MAFHFSAGAIVLTPPLPKISRSVLGHTQPPMQWTVRAVSLSSIWCEGHDKVQHAQKQLSLPLSKMNYSLICWLSVCDQHTESSKRIRLCTGMTISQCSGSCHLQASHSQSHSTTDNQSRSLSLCHVPFSAENQIVINLLLKFIFLQS